MLMFLTGILRIILIGLTLGHSAGPRYTEITCARFKAKQMKELVLGPYNESMFDQEACCTHWLLYILSEKLFLNA